MVHPPLADELSIDTVESKLEQLTTTLYCNCGCVRETIQKCVCGTAAMIETEFRNRLIAGETVEQIREDYFLKSGFLFNVGATLQADLDHNLIPVDLRLAFEKHKYISLSRDATVSVAEQDSQWVLTDRNRRYVILKDEELLNVYEPRPELSAVMEAEGFNIFAYAVPAVIIILLGAVIVLILKLKTGTKPASVTGDNRVISEKRTEEIEAEVQRHTQQR